MPAMILFRSLTYAQRGALLLERAGITAVLSKAPRETTDRGCTYCLRLSEARLDRAIQVLEEKGLAYGRLFVKNREGSWREVER